MTMTTAAAGRRGFRDSEAEIETEIFVRPQKPLPWDRQLVLQIMQELEPRTRVMRSKAIRPSVPAPGQPNVFLTPGLASDPPPPWAMPAVAHVARAAPAVVHITGAERVEEVEQVETAASTDETLVREGRVRTTRVPWLLFVMAFGIAFGIGQDPQLRRELRAQLHDSATRAAEVVESSAMRLARHVSGTR